MLLFVGRVRYYTGMYAAYHRMKVVDIRPDLALSPMPLYAPCIFAFAWYRVQGATGSRCLYESTSMFRDMADPGMTHAHEPTASQVCTVSADEITERSSFVGRENIRSRARRKYDFVPSIVSRFSET